MAVPHAGLGLPLLGAVVKGELDADLPLVSGRRVLAVGDRPTERVGVRHDAGALARPIGVDQNELRLAVFLGLTGLDRLCGSAISLPMRSRKGMRSG